VGGCDEWARLQSRSRVCFRARRGLASAGAWPAGCNRNRVVVSLPAADVVDGDAFAPGTLEPVEGIVG